MVLSRPSAPHVLALVDDLSDFDQRSDLIASAAAVANAGGALRLIAREAIGEELPPGASLLATAPAWMMPGLRDETPFTHVLAFGERARRAAQCFDLPGKHLAVVRRQEVLPPWFSLVSRWAAKQSLQTLVASPRLALELAAAERVHPCQAVIGRFAAPLPRFVAPRGHNAPRYAVAFADRTAFAEGLKSLRAALAILRRFVADASFVVLDRGRVPLPARRDQLAADGLELVDARSFEGQLSHVDAIVIERVLPSEPALFELAAERGLPVVAIGSPAEVRSEEAPCLEIPRRPPSFLADALHRLLHEDGLIERMAIRAKAHREALGPVFDLEAWLQL